MCVVSMACVLVSQMVDSPVPVTLDFQEHTAMKVSIPITNLTSTFIYIYYFKNRNIICYLVMIK